MPSRSRLSRLRSVYGISTSLEWSMTRRLTSSGTRSSKQRLPASMWKTGMPMRLATIRGEAAVGVAQHQQAVGLELREQPARRRRGSARSGPRSPSPVDRPGSDRARAPRARSKKTSLSAGSKFWPVWTRTRSQCRSSPSITRDSRMISGLRPEDGQRPSSRGLRHAPPGSSPWRLEQLAHASGASARSSPSCTRGPDDGSPSDWPRAGARAGSAGSRGTRPRS